MAQVKEFNPIETARKVEGSYREYIATTIHFDDPDLQGQLEEILRKPLKRRRHTAKTRALPNWLTKGSFARAC